MSREIFIFFRRFLAIYHSNLTSLKKLKNFFGKRLTNLLYRDIIIFVVRDKTPDRTK